MCIRDSIHVDTIDLFTRNNENVINTVRQFDAIVVGSDQVWRPKYFKDKIENAFLDFAKSWNIKRIAYAASFGTDEWEYAPKQTKRCGELLKLFDFVSVREMSGINLCATHFDLGAKLEPDPTMLLTTEDYMRLFEVARTPKSSGTLLYLSLIHI